MTIKTILFRTSSLHDQLKFRIFTLWDHRDTYRKTGKAGKGAECNINTGRVDRTLPYKKIKQNY